MKPAKSPRLAMLAATLAVGCATDDGPVAPATDAGATATVVVETSLGELTLTLEPTLMPVTTANFLAYVDDGFYDGTLIHRVVDDWVVQGGGYEPGLVPKPTAAPIPLETSSAVGHVHGAVSMARDPSEPDSATSQWFIVDWPQTGPPPQPAQLDGQFAAFGRVTEGLDVLEAIAQVPVGTALGLDDVPISDLVVRRAYRR